MNTPSRFNRLSVALAAAVAGAAAGLLFLPAPETRLSGTPPTPKLMRPVVHRPVAPNNPPATPKVVVTPAVQPPPIEPLPKKFPAGYNFALATNGASAQGGRFPEQLIDGNEANYSQSAGFAYTQWTSAPPQTFTVALKEPYTLDCVRFLLWDRDERHYRFRVEICADESGAKWDQVADHSREADQRKGWQEIRFPPQPVKFIRITGTFNSSNSYFHVVELQAFHGRVPPPKTNTPDAFDF